MKTYKVYFTRRYRNSIAGLSYSFDSNGDPKYPHLESGLVIACEHFETESLDAAVKVYNYMLHAASRNYRRMSSIYRFAHCSLDDYRNNASCLVLELSDAAPEDDLYRPCLDAVEIIRKSADYYLEDWMF